MNPGHIPGARRIVILSIGTLFLAFAPNCGTGDSTKAGRPKDDEVWIVDGYFDPVERTVNPGTRVIWINRDSVPHTVTSGVTHHDGRFESGEIPPGGVWRHTFDENGVYDYYCSLHPGAAHAAIVVGVSGNDLPVGP